jgi:hypothetical protein
LHVAPPYIFLNSEYQNSEKIAIRNLNIPHPAPLPSRERGIQGNWFHQMKEEKNDFFWGSAGDGFDEFMGRCRLC